MKKAICIWCAEDHGKVQGIRCKQYSQGFNDLAKQGIPRWVLIGMIQNYGSKILVDVKYFNRCGVKFAKMFKQTKGGVKE